MDPDIVGQAVVHLAQIDVVVRHPIPRVEVPDDVGVGVDPLRGVVLLGLRPAKDGFAGSRHGQEGDVSRTRGVDVDCPDDVEDAPGDGHGPLADGTAGSCIARRGIVGVGDEVLQLGHWRRGIYHGEPHGVALGGRVDLEDALDDDAGRLDGEGCRGRDVQHPLDVETRGEGEGGPVRYGGGGAHPARDCGLGGAVVCRRLGEDGGQGEPRGAGGVAVGHGEVGVARQRGEVRAHAADDDGMAAEVEEEEVGKGKESRHRRFVLWLPKG